MQISSAYSAGSGPGLQALRDLFQPASAKGAGQSMPTDTTRPATASRSSGQAPVNFAAGGFNTATLGALLGQQETSPADRILSEADADGNGSLDIDELARSLGVEASDLSESFAAVDGDGDGSVTGEELDAGLKAMFERQGFASPPSSSQVALDLLGAADTDGDGALSLDDILSALGQEEDEAWSETFSSLDGDGDGALGSQELTRAIESMMSRQMQAYAGSVERAGDYASVSA